MFFISCLSDIICKGGTDHETEEKNIFFFYPYGCTFSADDLPGALPVYFALLSLSSAKNNRTLSQQSADRIQAYYQASSLAEQALDQIDTILSDTYKNCGAESADASVYQKELTEQLKNCSVDGISDLTIDFTKKEGTLSFQVPVNKSQQLSVILTLPAPSDCQNGYYHITQWTTEATESWDGDDSYQLFSPVDS